MIDLRNKLAFLGSDLVEEILNSSSIVDVPKDTELLREEQYVKVLPIVIEGLLKVYSTHNDKELLLYYIQPLESCVMSFSSITNHQPSKIFAVSEMESKLLLIPAEKIPEWIKKYPKFNNLIYQQFNMRYTELLDTVQHMIFDKLEIRLHDYLLEKSSLTGENPLHLSHKQIASELGSAREVISRLMKKLEIEGKIEQGVQTVKLV
jgi:CRP/FNR family transcriptional regulator